jgi:U2 small nuclear ribonucleoprotein B''
LPEATTAAMLSMLFQQFPGFKEVRMVEAKPGIAFVEFETDTQASVALSGLQGFKINPTHSMTLAFAAK